MTNPAPLESLLEKLPSRPRIVAEVTYVLALVYLPGFATTTVLQHATFGVLVLAGIALLRPWRSPLRATAWMAAILVVAGCGVLVTLANDTG